MPSIYKLFFQWIIFDLMEIQEKFNNHDYEYSDFLIEEIKNIKFVKISLKTSLNLTLNLISRVNGINVNDQKNILYDIINYLKNKINNKPIIDSNQKSSSYNKKVLQLEKLEEICNNPDFFGPIPRIQIYEEVHNKLIYDIVSIFTNETNNIDIINKIKEITIPLINKESSEKIKTFLIDNINKNNSLKILGKDITGPLFVAKLYLNLDRRRLIIKTTIEGKERTNEMNNIIEKNIIERIFVNDGFFE